ncbi:hypothetical protein IHE44_0003333, partial [Lamprotornis superbus]
MAIGYVDGIPLTRYDSKWGRMEPLTQWMEDGAEQGCWDRKTQICERSQHVAAGNLHILRDWYNQSGGDIRGSYRDGYNGRDFTSFDLGSRRFVAADSAAEITRSRWEREGNDVESWMNYLEHEC